MSDWRPHISEMLHELLLHEAAIPPTRIGHIPSDGNDTVCETCHTVSSIYKCIDCFCGGFECASCIRVRHERSPFRRIKV